MEEKKFATGNIVQLKGSPQTMTIREYDTQAATLVLCNWISNKGEPQSQWYLDQMLTLVGE